jgi:glutathione S-transferase
MFRWFKRRLAQPVSRTPLRQQQVDNACQQLKLYCFPFCPYCLKVFRVIRQLKLDIERRDAATSPWADELRREGGKMQTPCLRIEDQDHLQWLYESEEIIHYLKRQFATSEDLPLYDRG